MKDGRLLETWPSRVISAHFDALISKFYTENLAVGPSSFGEDEKYCRLWHYPSQYYMTPSNELGNVYQISLPGIDTYVIIVNHIREGHLGFKSLLFQDAEPSIGIDQLLKYELTFICKNSDPKYPLLLEQMESQRNVHEHIWELFQPEGHYNSDQALLALSREGVVTSRTNTLFE